MIFSKMMLISRPFMGCLIFLSIHSVNLLWGCQSTPNLAPLIVTKEDSLKHDLLIKNAYYNIRALKKYIQSGDLVTRTGNDYTSERLRSLNQRNTTYSHCGIASIENDSLFVYHAMGGEWNPDEKLRRDSWEIFAEPYSNKAVGVFKPTIPDAFRDSLLSIAKAHHLEGLMFDMKFDLDTDDRMYCAEFIYKVYLKASEQTIQFNRSKLGTFEFIGVDDIFLHPIFNKQKEIIYN